MFWKKKTRDASDEAQVKLPEEFPGDEELEEDEEDEEWEDDPDEEDQRIAAMFVNHW